MGRDLPVGKYFAFHRTEISPQQLSVAGEWDVLISAYDKTDRVRELFERIQALQKHWIVHGEYGFAENEHPNGPVDLWPSFDPPAILKFSRKWANAIGDKRLCIDSTGFIRPHLLVLLRTLRDEGIRTFDILYSDPVRYIENENTRFTTGPIVRVDQIPGYEGVHPPAVVSKDVLVIGAGYEDEVIRRICDAKTNSNKYIFTGLPSLQPHMYQESVLKIKKAEEWTGTIPPQRRMYASASHPFIVAQVLHDLIDDLEEESAIRGDGPVNFYLSPVGPKPHVIGFAICYLRELEHKAASIIYPFAESYSGETTVGLRRTWRYRVEL